MAKSSALTRFSPRPIVINMPRRQRVRRAAGRAVRYVARRARREGGANLPMVLGAAGGAGVGYMVASGRLDFLPEIGGSKMITLGLAGWGAMRFSRNPKIRAVGFAALIAAAFDWGRAQGGGTHGDDEWGWKD